MIKTTQSRAIRDAIFLSLGGAVALGFARFNYALLLPAMREDLAWTYAQSGSMNTVNALGYLVGALIAAPVARRFGLARSFWVSLALIGLGLLGTGLVEQFSLLLIFRAMVGLFGAITFIIGATLASHLASQGQSGLILGLYFGGVGIGIFLAGLGLPQLLEMNLKAWRGAWILMGVLTLLGVILARSAALAIHILPQAQTGNGKGYFSLHLLPSLIAYFLFGLGYITYMTFVIAFLRSNGVAVWMLTLFWLILGVGTFASAFVWRRLLERAKGGQALAVVLGIVALGAALPIVSTSPAGIILSAIFFGIAFLSVVSAVTNIVRQALPSHAWAGGIALFTIIFSIGQTLGPLISGILADRSNTLTSGFTLSVLALFVGALLALLQRDPRIG